MQLLPFFLLSVALPWFTPFLWQQGRYYASSLVYYQPFSLKVSAEFAFWMILFESPSNGKEWDSAALTYSAIISQEEECSDLEFSRTKTFQMGGIFQSSYDIVPRNSADAIMSKLLMEKEEVEDELKKISHTLNLFYSLASDDEAQVGFMLCCQSMVRFCNSSFKKITREFLSEAALHVAVSEMHIDLLALGDEDDANSLLTRQFPHPSRALNQEEKRVLEIRASLLREDPPISLFISKCKLPEDKMPFNKSKIKLTKKRNDVLGMLG